MNNVHPFGTELRRLREQRKLSLRQLGLMVNFTAGYLSKIEHGRSPTAALARICDEMLVANGQLIRLAEMATEPVQPAQLPPPHGRFVARQAQLRHLEQVLRQRHSPGPTVMVLAGAPGVGKSALAIRAAHRVAAEYPHGLLYADLRDEPPGTGSRSVGEVLSAFLAALGIRDTDGGGQQARLALYRSLLSNRRALIVLDNADSAEQVVPLLPGGTDCTVLVTSRQRLSQLSLTIDPERATLDRLRPDESMQLLAEVVDPERVAAEQAAFAEVAVRCGHLPFALRIAAERIVARPGRTVRQLLDQLRSRPLDTLQTDDGVGVRGLFTPSYRRLDPNAAHLFRLLGLVPGRELDLAAVAALAGVGRGDADQLLDRLIAAHLVETRDDRYYLPALLDSYAAEQAAGVRAALWTTSGLVEQAQLGMRRVDEPGGDDRRSVGDRPA